MSSNPSVTVTDDAWMAQQREIEHLREANKMLAEERDAWKRHANNLRDRNTKLWRQLYLKQDGEAQASDEQAGPEVDLAQDQKDDVEQQDDEREQRPKPRTRKRISRH